MTDQTEETILFVSSLLTISLVWLCYFWSNSIFEAEANQPMHTSTYDEVLQWVCSIELEFSIPVTFPNDGWMTYCIITLQLPFICPKIIKVCRIRAKVDHKILLKLNLINRPSPPPCHPCSHALPHHLVLIVHLPFRVLVVEIPHWLEI